MANVDVTRIAGNIGALSSLNSLMSINAQLATHQARLSSGKRINSAADDPAGLTIATKLNARSEGLKTALDNIGDAKNLLATSESGMGSINDILIQMRNKAEAGASDTLGSDERSALVTQMQAYAQQIQDVVDQTKWNGKKLLNGSAAGGFGGTITFQTGADKNDITTLASATDMGITNPTSSGGLGIATAVAGAGTTTLAPTDVAVKSNQAQAIAGLTSIAIGTKSNANLAQAATGQYTVTASVAAGGVTTYQLFAGTDTSDPTKAMLVNAGSGGGANANVNNSLAAAAAGTTALDFGNGIVVTLSGAQTNTLAGTGSYTFTNSAPSTSYDLHLSTGGSLTGTSSATNFSQYMDDINTALGKVSAELTKIGSLTGRLTFKEDQVTNAKINVDASYNRIMNANMAEEQVNASKFTILQQTATAMLAQANQAPQSLLSLFR
jgi:flagellin